MSRLHPFNAKRRTLELLRARGWVGDDVERRNKFGSRDFLGFADLVVAKAATTKAVPARFDGAEWEFRYIPPVVAAIQATVVDRHADHVNKINAAEALRPALRAGYRVALVSWDKRAAAKGKRELWIPARVTVFYLDETGAAKWRAVNPDPEAWA